MTIPSGGLGAANVFLNSPGTNNALVDNGFMLMNSWTGAACGGTHDTSGVIRGYAEGMGSGGGRLCVLLGTPAGETHNYRAQRKTDSTCLADQTPYCAAAWNDGTEEVVVPLNASTATDISANAVIQGPVGGHSTAKGTYPGAGTQRWARTDDVHTPNQNDTTWTTVSSGAVCNSDSGAWTVGSLSGGFSIFYPGSGCP